MGFENIPPEEKNLEDLEHRREKVMEDFTVGDLDNPQTEQSIKHTLENIDAAIEETPEIQAMNKKVEGGTL